jgi:hypothetical protein
VLATEFSFAVAPPAVGDDRGNAIVDTAGIDCDRSAEARTDNTDALTVDLGVLREEGERVAVSSNGSGRSRGRARQRRRRACRSAA